MINKKEDHFFVRDNGDILWIYYNKDKSSGGAFVCVFVKPKVVYNAILAACGDAYGHDVVVPYILGHSYQEIIKFGTEGYSMTEKDWEENGKICDMCCKDGADIEDFLKLLLMSERKKCGSVDGREI